MQDAQTARFSEATSKYLTKAVYLFNGMLLLCHTWFLIYFKAINADIMFYFNCGSVTLYIVNFFILKFDKKKISEAINRKVVNALYIEIFVHMIVATICMGYEFGFLQYCFSNVPTVVFSSYLVSREKRISKMAEVLSLLSIFTYFALRLWTYNVEPIYYVDGPAPQIFFVSNSLFTLGFCYFYTKIFARTIFTQEDTLRNFADYDTLTGLRNRRSMLAQLEDYTGICHKQKKVLCIAMLDIDYFKKVNDTYGHDAGDEVLKKLSDILLERENELKDFRCARWGGEEFLMFYMVKPEHKDKAMVQLEFIRKRAEAMVVRHKDKEINITITIGAAFYDESQPIDTMISKADEMLYKGKESTRNCVMINFGD